MKLSTRTRYGTRALLELAMRYGEGPVFLKDIAREQQISLPYLEQLIAPLISGGIIRSTKGPKGGVSLVRKAENIKLIEITRLLEGKINPVECVDNPMACKRSDYCATRDIWKRLKEVINDYLEATSLDDLVGRQKCKKKEEPPVRY